MVRNEKIIVIRCFEKQKRNSSSIYKTKGQVFNPNSQAKTSFTLTDKVIHTNTRSSVHRNQSLYNRSHRIYIYLLYITSCKGIKKKRNKAQVRANKNRREIKCISKLTSSSSIWVLLFPNPQKHTYKKVPISKLKTPLFHNFLTVVCPELTI